MKQLFGEFPLRLLGLGIILVFVVLLVLTVQVLLVPFVAALFVVYLFDPGIDALQRHGVSRSNGYLVFLGLSAVFIVVLLMFGPSWLRPESVDGSTEDFTVRLQSQLTDAETWIDERLPMVQSVDIAGEVSERATVLALQFVGELPTLITAFAVNLLLVPFIAYFVVRDGRSLRRRVVALVPNRYFEMALIMFYRIDQQIGGYLRGRLIECMLVAVTQMLMMGVAQFFAPQPQILLISIVGGITTLIPYVGPVLGTAFGVFLYLGMSMPMASVWTLLIVVTLAHLVDNIVIAPAVLSHNVDLHPLTVVLVLVIGGEVLGMLGLLIAIPVASSIKVIAQEFYANYQAQTR